MSLKNHLNEMIVKHRALEKELAEAVSAPGISDSIVADIKRKKLRVKDEIMKIERDLLQAA